jgi:hypothetical protein
MNLFCNNYVEGIVRPLKFKGDRLQGQGSQAESVGESMKNSFLGVPASSGQGDTMPTRTEHRATIFCPENRTIVSYLQQTFENE